MQSSDFKDVAKIIIAAQASSSIESQYENAFNATSAISQIEVDLQLVSAQLFLLYYQATYQAVQELEPTYRTILFNDQEMLTADKRSELLPYITQ